MSEQISPISVMLDTNIFILGQKRSEHHKLKNLHREGRIKLYVSFDLGLEQEGKLQRHMEGPTQDAMRKYERSPSEKAVISLQKAIAQEEHLRSQIENEWDFWREININFADCAFNGLISAGHMPHDYLVAMDVKDEIPLLNELLSKYRIKTDDSMYAMVAHSAEMQFFLTWDDKKLI